MTRIRQFEIKLEHGVYFPGQTLSGQIKLSLTDEVHVKELYVQCKGEARTYWSSGSGKARRHHGDAETYLDKTKHIIRNRHGEATYFPRGHSTYDFLFTLPAFLPMSYEGSCGHVKYWMSACIRKEGQVFGSSEIEVTKAFAVANEGLNLNTVANVRNRVVSSDETIPCCSYRRDFIISILRLDKTGFIPGESIKFDAEIDNRSQSDALSSSVRLFRITTYRTRGGMEKVCRERVGTGNRYSSVHSASDRSYLRQRLPVPVDLAYITGQPGGSLIDVQYNVEFRVGMDCSNDLVIVIPITIGTTPLTLTSDQTRTPDQGIHVALADPPDYEIVQNEPATTPTNTNQTIEDAPPSYDLVMGESYTHTTTGPSKLDVFVSVNNEALQENGATWIEQLPNDRV